MHILKYTPPRYDPTKTSMGQRNKNNESENIDLPFLCRKGFCPMEPLAAINKSVDSLGNTRAEWWYIGIAIIPMQQFLGSPVLKRGPIML
jgi:hypothetical protein